VRSRRTESFFLAVEEEEIRANKQHGPPADIYEMLAILGEEYGELQKAILDFDYDQAPIDGAFKECVQVGAMVLKTYTCLRQMIDDEVVAQRSEQ